MFYVFVMRMKLMNCYEKFVRLKFSQLLEKKTIFSGINFCDMHINRSQ